MASDELVGRANVWRTAPMSNFRPMGHDIDQFEGHGRSGSLGLGFLWRAIYKRIKAVAALPTIAALAMGAIAFGQSDQYVASSVIEIDPRQTLKARSEEAQPDAERRKIEAEIQALKSPLVLERAIEKLDLSGAADVKPDFDRRVSRQSPQPAAECRQRSGRAFTADRLSVTRLRGIRFW